MEKDRLSRKLAVILHADVVGSTALVQLNETLAHQRIQAVFNSFSETIKNYGGITRELRGDALLAEFERASDAVAAALAFQDSNEEINLSSGDDIQPTLRIGISLGEVIIADNTITGAGVVLAQRLEQLADSGGIVVQGSVSETVPTRMPFEFESLGKQVLKGFDQPVRAYAVRLRVGEELPAPDTDVKQRNETALLDETLKRPVTTEQGKLSIAVLPFENMSGDAEQEYFSDGISEDIITELSRFHDLFVIARHSSFVFKNQSMDITEIGQKLGVQYVVEGSVRKSARHVRITAQLIEVATGSHVWAERYDRELEDIFAVQDEVVRTITSTLVGRVGLAHRDRAQSKLPSSMGAYDWLVQGRELYINSTADDNIKALEMFEKAILLDPNFASAYALLAQTYLRDWVTHWKLLPETSYDRAWANARKSMELDDTDSLAQTALGYIFLFIGRDHDQAFFHLKKALELNPGDIDALVFMSRCEMLSGNPERAVEYINEASRYNPFGKYNWSLVGPYYAMRRYDEAKLMMRAIQNPANMMLVWMAAVFAQAGNINEARNLVTEFIAIAEENLGSLGAPLPQSWLRFVTERWPFKHSEDAEHFIEGLRKAGVPE
jgi:adenylate cyclase